MKMGKTLVRDCKFSDLGNRVASHFGLLAVDTLAGPLCGVGFEGRPYEFFAKHLARAFYAWMAQSVYGFEYSFAPGERHKWASRSI